MTNASLQIAFTSVVMAKLLYASPAWVGFASAADKTRIESLLHRSVRAGFCPSTLPSFENLCSEADERLFKSIASNPNHVLYQILRPKVLRSYNLRPRPHDFVLLRRTTYLMDCNFATRMLFKSAPKT